MKNLQLPLLLAFVSTVLSTGVRWFPVDPELHPPRIIFAYIISFMLAQAIVMGISAHNACRRHRTPPHMDEEDRVANIILDGGFLVIPIVNCCVALSFLRPTDARLAAVLGGVRQGGHAYRLILATPIQPQWLDLALIDILLLLVVIGLVNWSSRRFWQWVLKTTLVLLAMNALHLYFRIPTPDALWVQPFLPPNWQ